MWTYGSVDLHTFTVSHSHLRARKHLRGQSDRRRKSGISNGRRAREKRHSMRRGEGGRGCELTVTPTQPRTTACWILSKKYATRVDAMMKGEREREREQMETLSMSDLGCRGLASRGGGGGWTVR